MKWALLPFVNEETVSENKASTAIHLTHLLGTYCVLGDEDSAGGRYTCPWPLEASSLAKGDRH